MDDKKIIDYLFRRLRMAELVLMKGCDCELGGDFCDAFADYKEEYHGSLSVTHTLESFIEDLTVLSAHNL